MSAMYSPRTDDEEEEEEIDSSDDDMEDYPTRM
jgi:hypothetical protein